MTEKKYMKPKEAATLLRMSESSLARWRQQGKGPNYSKLETGSILYEQQILLNYIDQNAMQTSC